MREAPNLEPTDEPLAGIDQQVHFEKIHDEEEERLEAHPLSTSASLQTNSLDVEGVAAASIKTDSKTAPEDVQLEESNACFVENNACFVVSLNTDNGLLGLAVDPDDGEALMVSAVDEGLVQEWNKNSSTRQVTVGDRILSVNGLYGSPMQLFDFLNESESLQLEFKQHSERSVTLFRDLPDRKLGLVLRHREGGNVLLVKEISTGIVEDWNRDHAGSEIRCGDRIVEVSGTRGRGSMLNDLLKTTNGKLHLTIIPIAS